MPLPMLGKNIAYVGRLHNQHGHLFQELYKKKYSINIPYS